MQPVNALALKEWAVVVHALGTGKQTMLLRKGGLHARHGRFATEPTEFFLFPTYVHQMEQGVTSEATADLHIVMKSRPVEDQLVIIFLSCASLVCLNPIFSPCSNAMGAAVPG